MQEYLIFKTLGLVIIASAIIWRNMSKNKQQNHDDVTNSYAEPVELEDGKFAIPKPEPEFLEGVEYNEVRTDPKLKENEEAARLPDPKGNPTIRP